MVFRVPSYYKNFRCIADKCPDNCCRGWEIDIDEDTLDYYKDLKGPMAEKIRASISEDGSFVLNEEGWCPLLNEKGLCEVCLTLGEDSLSEVCTEYPRFTTEYPKTREKVLCLSCGEVGRIVFSDTEQIGFDEQILSEDYDEYEWEDGDDELAEKLESVRSHAIGLLQDRSRPIAYGTRAQVYLNLERSRPIAERIAVYLNYCCQMQKELFETVPKEEEPEKISLYEAFLQRLSQYEELESIGDAWSGMEEELKAFYHEENYEKTHRAFMEAQMENEYQYEHLMVYYTFRYFMRAFYDNNLLEKAQFAVASFLMVRDMDVMVWMKNGQKFDLQDRIETTKVYAKEVEHSEENIEMLGESFLFEDVFSVKGLLAQIM